MVLVDDPVLQVGDRLRIVCPDAPEICVDRSVGSDGTVDVPFLGAFTAVTRRPSDLGQDIARFLLGATLPSRVEVRWIGSSRNGVSIEGAVRRSLHLFAPKGIAQDRLLTAAGATPDADLALLGPSKRLPSGTSLNVASISVDRRISVLGAVSSPRTLPPANAMPLSSAIESAGGLLTHGDPNAITVVRGNEPIPVSLPADAGFLLHPGDVVRVGFIADRRYVVVRGAVKQPGTVEYAPGMTATQALAAAGGLLPEANAGTLVWRTGMKTFRLSVAFLLERRIPDPALGPNDTITIEAGKP